MAEFRLDLSTIKYWDDFIAYGKDFHKMIPVIFPLNLISLPRNREVLILVIKSVVNPKHHWIAPIPPYSPLNYKVLPDHHPLPLLTLPSAHHPLPLIAPSSALYPPSPISQPSIISRPQSSTHPQRSHRHSRYLSCSFQSHRKLPSQTQFGRPRR